MFCKQKTSVMYTWHTELCGVNRNNPLALLLEFQMTFIQNRLINKVELSIQSGSWNENAQLDYWHIIFHHFIIIFMTPTRRLKTLAHRLAWPGRAATTPRTAWAAATWPRRSRPSPAPSWAVSSSRIPARRVFESCLQTVWQSQCMQGSDMLGGGGHHGDTQCVVEIVSHSKTDLCRTRHNFIPSTYVPSNFGKPSMKRRLV